MNRTRVAKGETLFANPRNATAGSLKLLDPTLVRKRPLEICLYSIINAGEVGLSTHKECVNYLDRVGLPTSRESALLGNIHDALSFIEKWENFLGSSLTRQIVVEA